MIIINFFKFSGNGACAQRKLDQHFKKKTKVSVGCMKDVYIPTMLALIHTHPHITPNNIKRE